MDGGGIQHLELTRSNPLVEDVRLLGRTVSSELLEICRSMQSYFGFAGAFQEVWMIASVGLLFASLIVLVGLRLLRRTRPVRPVPKENPRKPDPFDHGSASEKRNALRRRGKATKVYISDVENPDELSQGWVVDRSLTGLRLLVSQAVAPNVVLKVHSVDAPQNAPWVHVNVVRCSPEDDHWELGCEFVRTPSWSVLLQFN
jgi:hypothetical protein